jgi:hypothetical protein
MLTHAGHMLTSESNAQAIPEIEKPQVSDNKVLEAPLALPLPLPLALAHPLPYAEALPRSHSGAEGAGGGVTLWGEGVSAEQGSWELSEQLPLAEVGKDEKQVAQAAASPTVNMQQLQQSCNRAATDVAQAAASPTPATGSTAAARGGCSTRVSASLAASCEAACSSHTSAPHHFSGTKVQILTLLLLRHAPRTHQLCTQCRQARMLIC